MFSWALTITLMNALTAKFCDTLNNVLIFDNIDKLKWRAYSFRFDLQKYETISQNQLVESVNFNPGFNSYVKTDHLTGTWPNILISSFNLLAKISFSQT